MTGVPPVIRTARLVLDPPTDADVQAIFEYCQDPELQAYTAVPSPYRRSDAEEFVHRMVPAGWADGSEETFAIRTPDGALVGMIGCREELQDVGFWVGAPHRGRGHLGEALAAVLDRRFAAGQPAVHWECRVGNLASARVARRAGFHYTGQAPARVRSRDGSTPDSWHGVLRRDDPREPQPGWPEQVERSAAASEDRERP
jgi:RimJ/RimL family protein N-acetyltransferase